MSIELNQYFSHLSQLLEKERAEQFNQYHLIMNDLSILERRKQGYTWFPVLITHTELGVGGKWVLSIERKNDLAENHQFSVGSMVALFGQKDAEKKEYLKGVITFLTRNFMKVAFSVEELPDWIEEYKIGIDVLLDDVTFSEMKSAISKLIDNKDNRLVQLRNVLIGKSAPDMILERDIDIPFEPFSNLNDSQNNAIKKASLSKHIAVILGPPGTGKTTTIIHLIDYLIKTEKQILVTAPSNAAVDLLTQRLSERGIGVVRIGNPARVGEDLQQLGIEYLLSEHEDAKKIKKLRKQAAEFKRMAWQYKRKFGKEEQEQRKLLIQEAKQILKECEQLEEYLLEKILSNAKVITATLVGTNHPYLRKFHFNTVIIDEAGQALEPACWIPILKANRVIMAGDHCQLPPTVKSYEAAKAGLMKTLFEKIVELYPLSVHLLNVQYRMNEEIMEFSNEQFYGKNLKADEQVRYARISQNADLEAYTKPLTYIDTAGCGFDEVQTEEGMSKSNPEEARLLLNVLKEWLDAMTNELDLKKISIGIISPYQAQVACLHTLFSEDSRFDKSLDIQIQSIDSFQGQEKEMILISLVRSNDMGEIGFLKDTRRMNVALTRAKKKLIVIGNSATISHHNFYASFIAYCEKIGAYRSAWEYLG
ncbi:MAG: AAA domain-containing protein [Flammeovirgaceae bacterium]